MDEKERLKDLDERFEDFEDELEDFTERFTVKMEDVGREAERRYRYTFGILGPLLWSLLGLLFLSVMIWGLYEVGALLDTPVNENIADFLSDHLALLFGLLLLFNYWSYFSSKRPRYLKYFSPVMTAAGLVVLLWVLANVFMIINKELDIGFIDRFGRYALDNLREIFVIVLLIALLILVFKHGRTEKKYRRNKVSGGDMNRLYRSGKDKLLGGVCGGFGEYFDLDPVLVRIIWVILAFASLGTAVLIYIILWILIPRDPGYRWD